MLPLGSTRLDSTRCNFLPLRLSARVCRVVIVEERKGQIRSFSLSDLAPSLWLTKAKVANTLCDTTDSSRPCVTVLLQATSAFLLLVVFQVFVLFIHIMCSLYHQLSPAHRVKLTATQLVHGVIHHTCWPTYNGLARGHVGDRLAVWAHHIALGPFFAV